MPYFLFFSANKLLGQETALRLNQKKYFHSEIFSVLPFLSGYPSGKQGGLELILYDDRIATNGNVSVTEKITNTDEEDLHRVPIPPIEVPEKHLILMASVFIPRFGVLVGTFCGICKSTIS